MKQPDKAGWYWFLPDEQCKTPTGLLRLDKPVVLLVGEDTSQKGIPAVRLVVRFSANITMFVEEMTGDWEHIQTPAYMKTKAFSRIFQEPIKSTVVEYERLKKGEIVQVGDEYDSCSNPWKDDPVWVVVTAGSGFVGQPAPDPAYPAHTRFRRRKENN